MKRALALVLLLVGCESRGALDIVVPHVDGVTDVRLYIGVGAAMDQSIAPEGSVTPLSPAQVWSLDPHADADVRTVEGDADVVFELKQGEAGEHALKVAIVVGFDVDGAAIAAAKLSDIEIPSDTFLRHIVTLVPLSAQSAQVKTWPQGSNRCVAFSEGVGQVKSSLVVDGNDPDCDGIEPPLECSEGTYVYKQKRAATLPEVVCLKAQTVHIDLGGGSGSDITGCVLGGPTCSDGVERDAPATCGAVTPYCVPASVCAACKGRANPLGCASDLTSAVTTMTALPYIDCRINRDIDTGLLCPLPLTVQLDNYLPANGTKCSGPITISHGNGWAAATTFTASNLQGPATLTVSALDPSCNFTLQVAGTMRTTNTNGVVSAIVAGMLDNGRGFAIPVVVNGETSAPCTAGITCQMQTNSYGGLMKECLYSPVLGP